MPDAPALLAHPFAPVATPARRRDPSRPGAADAATGAPRKRRLLEELRAIETWHARAFRARPARRTLRATVLVCTDVVVCALGTLVSLVLANAVGLHLLGNPEPIAPGSPEARALAFLPSLPMLVGYGWLRRQYTRPSPLWMEVRDTVRMALYVGAVAILLLFAFREGFSRLWLASYVAWLALAVPAGRSLARAAMRRAGVWFRPVFVIGTGANARLAAAAITSDPALGQRVDGFIALEGTGPAEAVPGEPPTLSGLPDGDRPERWEEPPLLMFAFDSVEESARHEDLVDAYVASTTYTTIAPPVRGLPLHDAEILNVFRQDALLLRVRNNLHSPVSRTLKRAFDLVVAGAALALLAPVLAALWLVVRADGGAGLFGHRRVGRGGREFRCWKFRTMRTDGDEALARLLATDPEARREWRETRKLREDPRVTRVGRWLRATSLDELPQLFCVLAGTMSVVGPRPIVDDERDLYGRWLPYYLSMTPGLTGLWQTSGRSATTYAERVRLDIWYCRNWSLWYDLVIAVRTVPALLRRGDAC